MEEEVVIFHLPLCTSSPPLLTHWVQLFGSWGVQCPAVTMSLVVWRGGVPYVCQWCHYISEFLLSDEWALWGKVCRIRRLEGQNVAELMDWLQGEVFGLHGKDDFHTPSAMSVHVFSGCAWGNRKDSPIRSFWAGIIEWQSKNLLCECVSTFTF